eukprot:4822495-Alexandrium_andersonii.AAC.1
MLAGRAYSSPKPPLWCSGQSYNLAETLVTVDAGQGPIVAVRTGLFGAPGCLPPGLSRAFGRDPG